MEDLKLFRCWITAWKGYLIAAKDEGEAALIANREYYGTKRLPKLEERAIKAGDMLPVEFKKGVLAYLD